jgi:hypothetical protein
MLGGYLKKWPNFKVVSEVIPFFIFYFLFRFNFSGRSCALAIKCLHCDQHDMRR